MATWVKEQEREGGREGGKEGWWVEGGGEEKEEGELHPTGEE